MMRVSERRVDPALHYVLFVLQTFTLRWLSGAICFTPVSGGAPTTLALGGRGPGYPRNLAGERDGEILRPVQYQTWPIDRQSSELRRI
jgi:hypothetical protein